LPEAGGKPADSQNLGFSGLKIVTLELDIPPTAGRNGKRRDDRPPLQQAVAATGNHTLQ